MVHWEVRVNNMSGLSKVLAIVQCENCGKNIEIRHKKRLHAEHNFCSQKCFGEYMKKNNPNYLECPICGKLFYVKPSSQTGNNCCSRKCLGKLRETLYLGENNPNFGNKGSLNPMWKSDERISKYGYRQIRCIEHPFRDKQDFVFEHRLVAEKYLLNDKNSVLINGKRYLSKDFHVHHIDFNRLNNSPENLCVMPKSLHIAFHDSLYESQRDEYGHFIAHQLMVDTSDSNLMRELLMGFIEKNNANDDVMLINKEINNC